VPGPGTGFLQEAVRWWDHWLKGKDTGIMDGPMLRAFMGEAVPAQAFYDPCPGRWVAEATWPSPRVAAVSWHMSDGRLGREKAGDDVLSACSPQTTGLAGGEWCPYGTGGRGPEFPGDQREDDGRSLTFDGARLVERVEILGAPEVELELSVDRPVAYVIARLCDVAPDGASTRVSYGVLNLSHRESHELLSTVEPGKRYRVRLKLNDCAYAFSAGHRIRLALSTTYWPLLWPAPEPVTLTLHCAGSRLDLPVRAVAGDEPVPDLGTPESGPPSARDVLKPVKWENGTSRDIATGTTTVSALRDEGLVRLHSNGLEIGTSMSERMSIRDDDPLAAETAMTRRYLIGRGTWRTRIDASARMTATRTDFVMEAEMTAYEGEARVFERRWRRTIPRDGV
jgi:hypothetical protein